MRHAVSTHFLQLLEQKAGRGKPREPEPDGFRVCSIIYYGARRKCGYHGDRSSVQRLVCACRENQCEQIQITPSKLAQHE